MRLSCSLIQVQRYNFLLQCYLLCLLPLLRTDWGTGLKWLRKSVRSVILLVPGNSSFHKLHLCLKMICIYMFMSSITGSWKESGSLYLLLLPTILFVALLCIEIGFAKFILITLHPVALCIILGWYVLWFQSKWARGHAFAWLLVDLACM